MTDTDSLIGQIVGNFKIICELGRGGMGIVYKAHEMSLNRIVAVKILPSHLAAQPPFVTRFTREARAAAKLNHPGIVTVHAVGEHNGTYFIAMEYIKGVSLADMIHEKGQMGVVESLDIAAQVASALEEAHQNDIIHRDIKPQNIMIDRAGRLKVMDFGLAKALYGTTAITNQGSILGTPRYMSPEQVQDKPLDVRTDIYSLGIVLFEMLTGRVPFDAEQPMALMSKIVNNPLPRLGEMNPEVPIHVARIVERMAARKRSERYSSARSVAADLRSLQRADHTRTATETLPPGRGNERRPSRTSDTESQAVRHAGSPPSSSAHHRHALGKSGAVGMASAGDARTKFRGGIETSLFSNRRAWQRFGVGTLVTIVVLAVGYVLVWRVLTPPQEPDEDSRSVGTARGEGIATARAEEFARIEINALDRRDSARVIDAHVRFPKIYQRGETELEEAYKSRDSMRGMEAVDHLRAAVEYFGRASDRTETFNELLDVQESAQQNGAPVWAEETYNHAQRKADSAMVAHDSDARLLLFQEAIELFGRAGAEAITARTTRGNEVAASRQLVVMERTRANTEMVKNWALSELHDAEELWDKAESSDISVAGVKALYDTAAEAYSNARNIARQREGEQARQAKAESEAVEKRGYDETEELHARLTEALKYAQRARNSVTELTRRYAPKEVRTAQKAFQQAKEPNQVPEAATRLYEDAERAYRKAINQAADIANEVAKGNIDILLFHGLTSEYDRERRARLRDEGGGGKLIADPEPVPIHY